MKELTAINILLRAATQGSVNEISDGDAKSGAARETLAIVRQRILKTPFTFNTNENVSIPLDSDDRIPISRDWLRFAVPGAYRLSTRWVGDQKFLWDLRLNDYYRSPVVDARITFDIPDFFKIPNDAAEWITWEAAAQYYTEQKDGRDPPKWVVRNLLHAQSAALNTFIDSNIHDATGWTEIDLAATDVRVNIDNTLRAL